MKEKFKEYYLIDKKEKEGMWNEATFIFDACILLNLYRYSEGTRKEFLSILGKISDRIWIPHQFALEYQRNRLGVIEEQERGYDDVAKKLEGAYEDVENKLGKYAHRHPFIKIQKILKKLERSINDSIKETKDKKQKHPNWFEKDPIRDEIDELFKDKVGDPCDDLDSVEREGAIRYAKEIPPGYKDIKKDDTDPSKTKKFGDWIGWHQILKKAEKDKKPIILVTGEKKEDWWQEIGGKTIGPRFELIKEINGKGVLFHMYTMETFLQYAKPIYKVKPNTIKEVKEVNKKIIEDLESDKRVIQKSEAIETGQDFIVDTGSTSANPEEKNKTGQ